MPRKRPAPSNELLPTVKVDDAENAAQIADQAARLAEFVAKALIVAQQLGIQKKPLKPFRLTPDYRGFLFEIPGIPPAIKAKFQNAMAKFTFCEVADMAMALAEAATGREPKRQIPCLLVAKYLTDGLEMAIAVPSEPKTPKAKEPKTKADPNAVYQFKVTLLGSKPPIWRRIQVTDCTLDKLHEHIQTSMGWTNSHLHHFRIGEQLYGDPVLLEESMDEFGYKDSTRTRVSKIVPKSGKRFSFRYEYDFGDGWDHEVLFEGCPKKEAGQKCPLCLEGARACPPEDVGGIGGFYEFLEAIHDQNHERHEEMLEWFGGVFEPEEFNPVAATKEMKRGLPDWRNMV